MKVIPKLPPIVWQVILFEAALFSLAWVLGWAFDLPGPGGARLTWHGLWLGVLATLPLVIAMAWSLRSTLGPFARLRQKVDELIMPMFKNCSHLHFAMIALVAGLGEEALFRGVIQPGAAKFSGPVTAIALTSLLFGLAHYITPFYALVAALIGAYLGTLVMMTGNLLEPIVVHALYDFIALESLAHDYRRRQRSGEVVVEEV